MYNIYDIDSLRYMYDIRYTLRTYRCMFRCFEPVQWWTCMDSCYRCGLLFFVFFVCMLAESSLTPEWYSKFISGTRWSYRYEATFTPENVFVVCTAHGCKKKNIFVFIIRMQSFRPINNVWLRRMPAIGQALISLSLALLIIEWNTIIRVWKMLRGADSKQ